MPKKSSFWARSIGSGLAHLQDAVDHIVEFGFESLRTVGEKEVPKKKNENKHLRTIKMLGLGTLSFLGNLGDAYYEKYEDLKKKN